MYCLASVLLHVTLVLLQLVMERLPCHFLPIAVYSETLIWQRCRKTAAGPRLSAVNGPGHLNVSQAVNEAPIVPPYVIISEAP